MVARLPELMRRVKELERALARAEPGGASRVRCLSRARAAKRICDLSTTRLKPRSCQNSRTTGQTFSGGCGTTSQRTVPARSTRSSGICGSTTLLPVRACSRADRVLVYAFSHAADIWWRGIEGKLSRLDRLEVWRFPAGAAQALAALAERSMQLQATIQEGSLMLSSSAGSVDLEPVRWK